MINPLHLPVRSCQYSNYSTLSGALTDKGSYLPSSVKRLPQPAYSPLCKFHNTTSRLGSLQPAITFDYVGHSTKQGVKMQHLAIRDCGSTIAGGNDRILINGQRRMIFRILWPGYCEEWSRSIEIMSPGPITRACLGHIIAQNFLRFMEANLSAPCASSEWSLCSGKMRFENLILVSLVNTFEDSWQADVLVDCR